MIGARTTARGVVKVEGMVERDDEGAPKALEEGTGGLALVSPLMNGLDGANEVEGAV